MTVTGSVFTRVNDALRGLAAEVQQRVVQVRTGREGGGAGTIWRSDGLVLTSAHVLRRGPLEVALYDGRVFRAQVVARDDARDLAALALDGAAGLPAIEPADPARIVPGQWVMAVGHPWGVRHAVSGGVVIGREHDARGMDWVLVDVQLRPGNSGGPLVDSTGRLVGVNTLMTGPQVGAAVSAEAASAFVRERVSEGAAAVV